MIKLRTIPNNQTQPYNLVIKVNTALCVGAGGSSGSLADKPIIRNAEGKLLIPASQVKGRWRHECEKLATALGWQIFYAPTAEALCPREDQVWENLRSVYQVPGYKGYHCIVSQIFGNPILPSRLIVDDFICPVPANELPEILRPGVTINRRRRTSEERKLYLLETSPVNVNLPFEGNVYLQAPWRKNSNTPDIAKPLIFTALRLIDALGGSKSAGLGWLSWENVLTISENDPAWSSLIPPQRK